MAYDNPFQLPGNWYKGNLHTHTTLSDGHYTPAERIRDYRERGYDFLALTDHGLIAQEYPAPEDFLVLSGVELDRREEAMGVIYHFVIPEALGLGLPPKEAKPQEVLAWAKRADALTILAHPYWSGLTLPVMLAVQEGVIGLEVFNTVCERQIGRGLSSVHWDELLEAGFTPLGLAVDDTHTNRTYIRDSFQGWVMVKAPALEKAAILEAIRRGAFYATSGPAIQDIILEKDRVRVQCSPVRCINFICHHPRGKQVLAEEGDELTSAEFVFCGGEQYVRIECTDRLGRTAWSNPFRLEG